MAWDTPVKVDKPIPQTIPQDTTWEEFWSGIFPWEFPGQNLRTPGPMKKGSPQPLPQTAPSTPGEAIGNAAKGLVDDARKAAGINPSDWQTFIKQTATDWGVYAGLAILGILGLIFLISASGGGTLNPLSPYSVYQRGRRSIQGTRKR